MLVIDQQSAECYLRGAGHVGPSERIVVRELTGGVSNMVLLVERPDVPHGDFVLKQAREKLRTAHDWFCRRERIWREADVLRECSLLLRPADHDRHVPLLVVRTPDVLFEDREHYLMAISAAPRPNRVWKQDLLEGRVDPDVAAACGQLLGTLHGGSWRSARMADALGDCSLFVALRVDPYYRTLANAQDNARAPVERLIASLEAHPRTLVHADFSPKNMLLFDAGMSQGLMLVDFETGHFGDPAFDLGFFLSHLVLKACHRMPDHARYLELTEVFQRAYDRRLGERVERAELEMLWSRGIQHFAACAWARLDGKSPVDYLADARRRELMRALCHEILADPPAVWRQVVRLASDKFDAAAGRDAPVIPEEQAP